jgi:hypothetical protein
MHSRPLFMTHRNQWLGAPVYPVLLAGLFTILEVETKAFLVAAAILNSLSAVTAGVIYKIGARQFGDRVGLWAAWGWALYPYVVLLVGLLWEATLSALILCCAIYRTLKTGSSESRGDWMLGAAAGGSKRSPVGNGDRG